MGSLAQEYAEPPEIEFIGLFWTIFGLPGPNFTTKQLMVRYRALLKLYHPDKNKAAPDQKKYHTITVKIGFIHGVLRDKVKLQSYIADPNHEDFAFPGENVGGDAPTPEAPAGGDAKPDEAKPAPSLGQLKLYFSFSHFQSDDCCRRFRSDDYCHPARASPQTV